MHTPVAAPSRVYAPASAPACAPSPARLAALAAALSLGLAASPTTLRAALITIDAQQTFTQTLGGDAALLIEGTGSIETATDDGVRPSTSGAAIGNIDNDGLIDVGGDGVRIDGAATLTGNISNTGTVRASGGTTADGNSDGIEVSGTGTVVTGNIVNSGTIEADTDGIDVSSGAEVQGNVANASGGQIVAGETGIEINAAGAVSGTVSNAGSIDAEDGIAVSGGASVLGEIRNEAGGVIDVSDDGIEVESAQSGSITNAGAINSASDGIVISSATVDGSITNAAGGTIDTATGDDGIDIGTSSTVTGNVANAGRILAGDDGIAVTSGSLIGGDIRNEAGGEIVADGVGIHVTVSQVDGGIANAGSIEGLGGIVVSSGAEVTGDLTNSGSIDGAVASIFVTSASVSGDVNNSGTLSGDLFLAGVNGSGDGIDLANSGAIDLRTPSLVLSFVSGDFTQSAVGSLAITLLSFADYFGDSPLTILGDAELAGELLLGFDPGFAFAPDERLTLIDVGGIRDGLFANYADDALVASFGPGRDLFIDYTDEGNVELYSSASVPLPPSWLLIGAGLFGWGALGRRRG